MIVFDLACAGGHVFEAWFGSSADYEDQCARGLVTCPICGLSEVTKAVMAPAIAAKGNQGSAPVPMSGGGAPPSAEVKAVLAKLAEVQARMLAGSEHVGSRFATEARAIHAGESAERPIHGHATMAEAKALVEDGVSVTPLPLPVAPPATTH